MPDLPSHAYIPGRTARHAEDAFDAIKDSVTDEVPLALIYRTRAFSAGLRYLHAGYHWECHEVLEAVWLRTPDASPEREMTQALIQLANARLKLAMDRPKAAARLCGMVAGHLDRCGPGVVMGLDPAQVRRWLADTEAAVAAA